MITRLSVPCLSLVLFSLPPASLPSADLPATVNNTQHPRHMAEGMRLFKERVRGILEKNCLECHGGEEVEADLDLTTRESLIASGLVVGSSGQSGLMDAITHTFEPFMPHERERLDPEFIDAIARWIDLGAPYDAPLAGASPSNEEGPLIVTDKDRDYWAYKPLQAVKPPTVKNALWRRTEIDRFVLTAMEEAGLTPNLAPTRVTLIRRAYLNAIGLPPTPRQVADFVNDFSPLAYERMIDRLLESPHYGERWARHWMDIARFAESTGFEIDFDRPYAYHYRDFLIKAFNQNMPYDQFIQWQIAGDELAPEKPLALMATGFLGAGPFPSVLTEKEFESARYDELDDMVNTLGTAMLGTTMGCARCHDHKHDPISTRDYYALAANFTRTVRSYVDFESHSKSSEFLQSQARIEERKRVADLENYESNVLDNAFRAWLDAGSFEVTLERWFVLSPDSFSSREGATLTKLLDDSVLVGGLNATKENDTLFFQAETHLTAITGLRMETLTHPSLPNNGPGRDHEGGFTIREIKVHIRDMDESDPKWREVPLKSAKASSQENATAFSASAAINGVSQGWSIDLEGIGKDQALAITFAEPVGYPGGSRIRITVSSGYNLQQMVGRPRFSITQDPRVPLQLGQGMSAIAYNALLELLIGRSPNVLTAKQTVALRRWYGRNDPGWAARWNNWLDQHKNWPPTSRTQIQVSSDSLPPVWHRSANKGFPSRFESTYQLSRGDVARKGIIAEPGLPQVLVRASPAPTANAGQTGGPRVQVAQWLTDVEAGAGSLLARVFVNRLWHHHFGRGLVATPSDFGTQGDPPTHPDLLEWLAGDFVDHGWNVKRLQKQIMTSAVYRQDSAFNADKSESDPENTLLWRFPSRRVEAEVIRDSMLQVSGMLDPTLFGPGSRDPAMRRRSIYYFIKRGALIPEMVLFDWPEHLVSIGRRTSTTVAPQALRFLNSPSVRRYALSFSKRLSCDNQNNKAAWVREAYQLALNRLPKPEEIRLGIDFIESRMKSYRNQGYGVDLALVDYCQSLFSLNEFIYIR